MKMHKQNASHGNCFWHRHCVLKRNVY